MLLYAITDRTQLSGATDDARRDALISLAGAWAAGNIDYIQIREKDLAPSALLSLTQQIVAAVRARSTHTRVLLNGPASIALQAHADGVHLSSNVPAHLAAETRSLFASAGRDAVISHACHSLPEVLRTKEESQRNHHATAANTLILFAPVFEKRTPDIRIRGLGLSALHAAAKAARPIPILALGGVTTENTPACLNARAAGIASIRLFLQSNWPSLNNQKSV
jgi:thiamine monophosphate synthase